MKTKQEIFNVVYAGLLKQNKQRKIKVNKNITTFFTQSSVQDCVVLNRKFKKLCDSEGNTRSSPALIEYNNHIAKRKACLWNMIEYNRNLRLELQYNECCSA